MAIATILRRSAAYVAPLATRFVVKNLHHHHAAAVLLNAARPCRSGFTAGVRFSTEAAKAASSSKALLKYLEAEIACADEEDEEEVEDVPAEFPFKIEDNSGEAVVKLTRQYEGETIEVEVYAPDLSGVDNDYDDDKDDDEKDNNDKDDDEENSPQSTLPLLVKVSKYVGPTLEFSCTATPDEIHIDNLSVKNPENPEDMAYDGPDFGDLDENLQKAFHKYLNIRGISPSTTNFMHEYMVNKDAREYKMWLKNLKKFVEA